MAKRKALVESLIQTRTQLNHTLDEDHQAIGDLRREEAILRAQIGELEVKLPRVRSTGPIAITQDPKDLRKVLVAYQVQHRRWSERYLKMKAEIETEYADLISKRSRRFRLIETAVAQYATSFLGVPCTFQRVEAKEVNKDVRFNFPTRTEF